MIKDKLSMLHKDKMDIYRYEEVKINGVTKFDKVKKYTDVLCRLSKEKLSGISEGNTPELKIVHKIFTSPEIDIVKGDEIIINHKNKELTFKAGESFQYTTHTVIYVQKKEVA